ncbi:hypothetical protein K1728_00725 [Weissella confusa]|uniref:hypothetical protein n=1 Tax=Weissella confusa TaxID=1583 RepID=UPI001C6FA744|nr:hypothetical protein [Weissella confusa]QYU57969.1 hypothetical protein K1728_00725 [Weissella confusa]
MQKLLSDFSDKLRDSFNRETRLHGSPRKIWYITHQDELDSVGVSELAKVEYQISEMQHETFSRQMQRISDDFGSLTTYMSYVKKVEKTLSEERKARNQESTENLENELVELDQKYGFATPFFTYEKWSPLDEAIDKHSVSPTSATQESFEGQTWLDDQFSDLNDYSVVSPRMPF